ncbi:MAG: hypothetical protein IJV36_01595 [Prevotella sp.]|nr:hypothetical protein [Prevotella sp.]
MKQRFTLFIAVLLATVFACQIVNAQTITQSNFTDNGHTVPQGEVVWFGTTLDDAVKKCDAGGYVYLYNVKTGKFLNAGGAYGVHAVLSAVGMRLKVTQTTYGSGTVYTVMGRIDNQAQGSYMSPNGSGNDIYMDRDGTYQTGTKYSQPNWQFTLFTQPTDQRTVNGETQTFTNYRFTNYHRTTTNYVGTNGANSSDVYFVNQNGNNNIWRIISEEDYKAAMDNVTWGSVDLGSFLKDAEFGRDNMDGRYWVWSDAASPAVIETATDAEGYTYTTDNWNLTAGNIHWHQRNQDKMCNELVFPSDATASVTIPAATIGTNVTTNGWSGAYATDNYRGACAQYYAAEIYNEKITLSQEISMSGVSNLKEGLYKMTAQALYYDDLDGLTNANSTIEDRANAYFFVKTESEIDGETVTTLQELPIIAMNKVSNNIQPHSGVSAGYVFDHNSEAYLLEFFVELKGETKITIGMRTEEAKGWTVIGNVHMYAHGKQALFLDENWTKNYEVVYEDATSGKTVTVAGDPYELTEFNEKYGFPATVYYTRTLNKGMWSTICMPLNLTGSQVRSAFGGDTQVSKYKGVSADGRTIVFEKVDLDLNGMDKCVPYIIKPSKDPDVAAGNNLHLEVGNGSSSGGVAVHYVDIVGPIYFIPGVMKEEAGLPTPIEVTDQISGTGITFKGNFYLDEITKDDLSSTEYWVITKNNMYHLNGGVEKADGWKWNVWATYAYLSMPAGSGGAKDFTMVIKNTGEEITAIEGLEFRESNAIAENARVYNLSGQSVNKGNLQKGIYIVNGRKYVVK